MFLRNIFLPEYLVAGFSETLAESFQTTRRPIVDDNYLHRYSRQNLKYPS
jgi:hypothetical protein